MNTETQSTIPADAGALVTRQEMADRLNMSVRSFDRLLKARVVPFIRCGRLIRLNPERVMEALHRNLEVKEIGA